MGMVMGLYTVCGDTIEKIKADPAIVWRVISPDDSEMYLSCKDELASSDKGLFARLFGKKKSQNLKSKVVPELELAEGEGEGCDLDKAWHGLHYMLTKTAWEGEWPLNFIAVGGDEVPGVEVGFGPARLITPDGLKEIVEAIGDIDDDCLRERFDPADMMAKDIYPNIWDRDPEEDDTFGYCIANFHAMKDFLSATAGKGFGVMVTME